MFGLFNLNEWRALCHVVNGESLLGHGACPNLPFSIYHIKFVVSFYLMEFGGCDMVLGAQWLQILGPILWGFSKMWMPFKINSQEFTINAMISSKTSTNGSS